MTILLYAIPAMFLFKVIREEAEGPTEAAIAVVLALLWPIFMGLFVALGQEQFDQLMNKLTD